jgi:DNA-binding SARP family transcriptional activator
MEFGVLGPLKVWWPSPAGPLTAPKLRGLLALLLVEDDPVPAGQLMELFRGRREAGGPTAMHVSVHKLRRWLHGGHRLELTAQGYTIDVDPALVDAGQFRLRLAAADAAADPYARIELLRSAVSLWRGRIGADLPVSLQQRATVRRLEGLRVGAVVGLAEACLAAGQPCTAFPYLDDLAQGSPFDERVQAQFALVLAACGRQADALAVIAETRRLLADELGIESGPQLREAYLRILRQRVLPAHP